jgi:hypothetical protein
MTFARHIHALCRIGAGVLLLGLIGFTERAFPQLVPNLGSQRAGISAYQFLKIGAGARAVGMGESFIAVANDVSALYWNPAGIAQFPDDQVIAAHTEWVVDLKHEFFGAVHHFSPNDVLGVSITALHTADMQVTTETQPFGTGSFFTFGDLAVGLSYGKKMTDQFSFGVTFKYVEETLDVLKMKGLMMELGTYYRTGIGSSRFAVVVSNFGADVAPSGEVQLYNGSTVNTFQSFSPPTQFKIGFAMEPFESEGQRLTTSLELQHPNDNAENIHLGVEYQWERWLSLRAGIRRTIGEPLFGHDNTSASDYALGFGIAVPIADLKFGFDYAWSNYNILGNVHRITLIVTY